MSDNKDEINADEEKITKGKVDGYMFLVVSVFMGWLLLTVIDMRFGLETHKAANFLISTVFSGFCQSLANLVRHELNRTKAQ